MLPKDAVVVVFFCSPGRAPAAPSGSMSITVHFDREPVALAASHRLAFAILRDAMRQHGGMPHDDASPQRRFWDATVGTAEMMRITSFAPEGDRPPAARTAHHEHCRCPACGDPSHKSSTDSAWDGSFDVADTTFFRAARGELGSGSPPNFHSHFELRGLRQRGTPQQEVTLRLPQQRMAAQRPAPKSREERETRRAAILDRHLAGKSAATVPGPGAYDALWKS